MAYQHLSIRRAGPVEHVELNRPAVRNALDDRTIAELTRWAEAIPADRAVRAVVLRGAGPVFCAGADLAWMTRVATQSHDDNLRDARAGARLFGLLDALPVPLIGRVHGAALGGGAGLAAVCDVVVAEPDAAFGFTEVKLGIIPAMIAPYVLAKIGPSAARDLFLTGRRFDARHALTIGLVHAVVPPDALDATIDRYLGDVLDSAPGAITAAKRLVAELQPPLHDVAGLTAHAIADRRASAEGQEGMRAFLEKRPAAWKVRR